MKSSEDGGADVIIGATAAMADYNGCPKASHIKDKLVEDLYCHDNGRPAVDPVILVKWFLFNIYME